MAKRKRGPLYTAPAQSNDLRRLPPARAGRGSSPSLIIGGGIAKLETPRTSGKGKHFQQRVRKKFVEVAVTRGRFYNPADVYQSMIANQLSNALDPRKANSTVKEWKDMTEEERDVIRKRLGVES